MHHVRADDLPGGRRSRQAGEVREYALAVAVDAAGSNPAKSGTSSH